MEATVAIDKQDKHHTKQCSSLEQRLQLPLRAHTRRNGIHRPCRSAVRRLHLFLQRLHSSIHLPPNLCQLLPQRALHSPPPEQPTPPPELCHQAVCLQWDACRLRGQQTVLQCVTQCCCCYSFHRRKQRVNASSGTRPARLGIGRVLIDSGIMQQPFSITKQPLGLPI